MGISKALFQEVGAFNEALPQLEDTDFCIRAQLLGAELHFVADAVLHLRWRSTARQCFRQAMNWAEFNTILARRYWPADASTLGRWKVWLRDLVRLPRKMPRVLSVRGRYELAFFLGWQTGRLKGVLKHNGVPV
jgi:GT2 family glycosyltransferase